MPLGELKMDYAKKDKGLYKNRPNFFFQKTRFI